MKVNKNMSYFQLKIKWSFMSEIIFFVQCQVQYSTCSSIYFYG